MAAGKQPEGQNINNNKCRRGNSCFWEIFQQFGKCYDVRVFTLNSFTKIINFIVFVNQKFGKKQNNIAAEFAVSVVAFVEPECGNAGLHIIAAESQPEQIRDG